MSEVAIAPGRIRTRERLDNMDLAAVKSLCEAELGKPNRTPIGDHAAGSLKAMAVTADGGPHRWRIFYEWEPV